MMMEQRGRSVLRHMRDVGVLRMTPAPLPVDPIISEQLLDVLSRISIRCDLGIHGAGERSDP